MLSYHCILRVSVYIPITSQNNSIASGTNHSRGSKKERYAQANFRRQPHLQRPDGRQWQHHHDNIAQKIRNRDQLIPPDQIPTPSPRDRFIPLVRERLADGQATDQGPEPGHDDEPPSRPGSDPVSWGVENTEI